ncbi:MAG: sortase [Patescibacteria group bacterium]
MTRKTIQPPKNDNDAADLIRNKLQQIYQDEPNAKQELAEAEQPGYHSKHQRFMLQLNQSGKSMSQIQTDWHNYYLSLPDHEKHQVWHEFYSSQSKKFEISTPVNPLTHQESIPNHKQYGLEDSEPISTISEIQHQIRKSASHKDRKKPGHLKSLGFGLGLGSTVVLIMLFSFFNERFIVPFISPSKNIGTASIIIDPNSTAVGPDSLIIIPKINVEIPVVYDEPSIEEAAVQKALERGVLHYATTPKPGEQGNGVIFGHSSNNILNNGKYKFAFVLLKKLDNGDVFYVQKNSVRYAYKVFEKKIVDPGEVGVLGSTQKASSFTLITCDPPGTSLKRLVVVGEQITPDPNKNIASSTTNSSVGSPSVLPSNAPSLWSRITDWF